MVKSSTVREFESNKFVMAYRFKAIFTDLKQILIAILIVILTNKLTNKQLKKSYD